MCVSTLQFSFLYLLVDFDSSLDETPELINSCEHGNMISKGSLDKIKLNALSWVENESLLISVVKLRVI